MSKACELCKGACCESILLPISPSPTSTEFYAARGSVFHIAGSTFAEVPARCPHLSGSGKCKTYPSLSRSNVRFFTLAPNGEIKELTFTPTRS